MGRVMLRAPLRSLQSILLGGKCTRYQNRNYNLAGIRPSASTPSLSVRASLLGSNAPIRLREYQEECIQSVLSYLENGEKRLGVSLATGSGKTVIFTQLIDRVQPPTVGATRTLILVHRRELAEQAARHCINAYPAKTVEIEMGNMHASGLADITIASIYSITSGNRMEKFDPSRFKLVLVDEAHHIVASSFMETLKHFGLLKNSIRDDSPALVGVSATLSRFDGLRLSDAIDHIVYHKDYIQMIEEEWLSNVIFTTVKSKVNLSRIKKATSGDFQVSDLSRAVNTSETNEVAFRAWMLRARGRKSTLVFCVDLAHVADLTATFRSHGIDAKFVTGDTPKMMRSERLDAFRNREFPVLLNCGVFTEGTDIPNVDCVLLARPTKSRNLLVQMIGRGMRLHPGKTNCHIIDMVATLEAGVVTTPSLFGLDPASMVDEADIQTMKSDKERKESEERREELFAKDVDGFRAQLLQGGRRSITFTDYDSVYDLIDDTSGERHIRSISSLAWVMIGDSRYILSSQGGSYLTIETLGPHEGFSVIYTQKLSEGIKKATNTKSPFKRPREIAKAVTFADAVHAADTFASGKFPYVFINHGQAWRQRPATESQIVFLNKLRPVADQLTPDMISKGKANDMITKTKFGAKGWFNKLKTEKRREGRAVEKSTQADEMKKREQVKIGPLTDDMYAGDSHRQTVSSDALLWKAGNCYRS